MHAGVAGDPCGSCASANECRLLGTRAALREESRCLSVGLMLPLETKGWLFISWSSPLVLAFLRHISHAVHGGGLLPSGGVCSPQGGAQPHGAAFFPAGHVCTALPGCAGCFAGGERSQDPQFGHPGSSFTISSPAL